MFLSIAVMPDNWDNAIIIVPFSKGKDSQNERKLYRGDYFVKFSWEDVGQIHEK